MIVVAGHLRVPPERRADYLNGCRDVIELARTAPGCLDFTLSADPLEPDRINIFERWISVNDVEAFRGTDPDGPDADAIISAAVAQYEVSAQRSL
jgi:quinol monooxygenase YgiN